MQTKKTPIFFIILGIRSDSDMYSYSFSWKVWKSAKIIASGEEIKNYLTTAVEEEGNFSTALYSTGSPTLVRFLLVRISN